MTRGIYPREAGWTVSTDAHPLRYDLDRVSIKVPGRESRVGPYPWVSGADDETDPFCHRSALAF